MKDSNNIKDTKDTINKNSQIATHENLQTKNNITYIDNELKKIDANKIPNNLKESSKKDSEYNDINKNEDSDTTAPRILTASINKSVYKPGETVNMSVRIEEANELSDVSVGFSNDTSVGIPYLSEIANLKNIHRESKDIWVVDLSIPIPKKTGNTSFSFAALVVDDVSGNGDTLAPRLEPTNIDVSKLNFTVKNDHINTQTVDTTLPKITKITTDKSQYHAGDAILAHAFIENTSMLSEVSLGFVNKPYTGYDGFSQFAKPENIIKIGNGLWRVEFNFKAPDVTRSSVFKFSHVSAKDEFNNSIGIVDDFSISTTEAFTNYSITVLPNEKSKINTSNLSNQNSQNSFKPNNQNVIKNKKIIQSFVDDTNKLSRQQIKSIFHSQEALKSKYQGVNHLIQLKNPILNDLQKFKMSPSFSNNAINHHIEKSHLEDNSITTIHTKVIEKDIESNHDQSSKLPNTGIQSQSNILLVILSFLILGGYLLFKSRKVN